MLRKYLTYFRWIGLVQFFKLVYSLIIDRWHLRIPPDLFQVKHVMDFVLRENGTLQIGSDEIRIEVNGLKYLLRRSGSDLSVFHQIVIDNGVARMVELLQSMNIEAPKILDCGANIGLVSMTFMSQIPDCEIIALEPEIENFKQLQKNIKMNGMTGIASLQMGVWYQHEFLAPSGDFRDGMSWSFSLKPTTGESNALIEVEEPGSIVSKFGWDRIDVLKIDIEGAEFPLLRNIEVWYSTWKTVRIISIEIHEEVGSYFEIVDILLLNGFKLEKAGELLIGVKS